MFIDVLQQGQLLVPDGLATHDTTPLTTRVATVSLTTAVVNPGSHGPTNGSGAEHLNLWRAVRIRSATPAGIPHVPSNAPSRAHAHQCPALHRRLCQPGPCQRPDPPPDPPDHDAAAHPRAAGRGGQDGQIVLSEAYGLANVENGVLASRHTRFPLNSATKAFTGVAAAQLAQEGRLDLDAPASRYRMIFHQRGQTYAYTSCWRIPPAFRTSLMRTGCWALAQKRRRGRPSLRSRSKPNPGSASPTTRPTTFFWHGSSRSNPACPTNVFSPPASSAARAWPAPPSATATT